ncbi:MAG: glycosyltransferase, partial [Blastocatellia bacterium]
MKPQEKEREIGFDRAMEDRSTGSKLTEHPSSKQGVLQLRVLIVAPSLDIVGGQAVQASRLVKGFRESGRIEVGFSPHNPRLPGPLRGLQSIKYVRTVVTSLLYFASLLLRVGRYDVIHVFSASYFSYLLCAVPAILIARLFGKKSVLNYRSGEAEDHLKRWRRTAAPLMRLADKIVVPSGYLVDVFKRFGLQATAVFNMVDTEIFAYRDREPLRPVFLSNRNLEALYNVGCILTAFGKIQDGYPGARLIVAGDGKQRAALERKARELGLRNTEFVGQVPPQKMNELYREADIY